MSCNCHKTVPLPGCITNLTIGRAEPNTNYLVIFKTPDGRMDLLPSTSTADGYLVVSGSPYRTGTLYKIWISLAADANIDAYQPFSIGEKELYCLNQQFVYCTTAIQNQAITLL